MRARRLVAFVPKGMAQMIFRWLTNTAAAVRCVTTTMYTLFFPADAAFSDVEEAQGPSFSHRARSTRNVISASFMRCHEQNPSQLEVHK